MGDERIGSASGVLCADVDAMFAAIEARERGLGPEVPILVGGSPESRGVVSTASYAARRFGCHSAMPMAQAIRLCPQALRFPPRHDLYAEYSRKVMGVLSFHGPLEQMSIDEAYVEIDAARIGRALGLEIKDGVRKATGLTISVGLAANKLVSKVASAFAKPDGLTVVEPGAEAAFLAPLDVEKLPGVGPRTRERVAELGVRTIGDLALLPLDVLTAHFGPAGGQSLYEHSHGRDDSPVVVAHDLKQISQEMTFPRDVADRAILWRTLREQSEGVARRLTAKSLLARTITLKLRYADFQSFTRSVTLPLPTDDSATISRAAADLIRANWDRARPIRLLGVGASRFVDPESWVQLPLPFP
jgi:nucleotidyltransferase/DNA polymerase involved in DNA repair